MNCPDFRHKLYNRLADTVGVENAYRIYHVVNTNRFKDWFGEGKLDSEGNPFLSHDFLFYNDQGKASSALRLMEMDIPTVENIMRRSGDIHKRYDKWFLNKEKVQRAMAENIVEHLKYLYPDLITKEKEVEPKDAHKVYHEDYVPTKYIQLDPNYQFQRAKEINDDVDHFPKTTTEEKKEVTKSDRVIAVKQDQIRELKRSLHAVKSDPVRVARKEAMIAKLEAQIKAIKDDESLGPIIAAGREDMDELSKMLNTKDLLGFHDLEYIIKTIEFWDKATKAIEDGGFFHTEDQFEMEKGKYVSLSVESMRGIAENANNLRGKYAKAWEQSVRRTLNDNGIEIDKNKDLLLHKEINPLEANLRGISTSDNPIVQLAYKMITEANYRTEMEVKEIGKTVDDLVKEASKNPHYKKGIMEQKDKDGKRTGNLINRFTQTFYEARAQLINFAKEKGTKEAWKELKDWSKKNTITFDQRKLFYDKYSLMDEGMDIIKYSQSEIDAHIKELKDTLGERGYEEYYAVAKRKFDKYEKDLEAQREILEKDEPDFAIRELKLRQWVIKNSPFAYVATTYEGLSNKVAGEYITPSGWKYTVNIPRKFIDGKKTEWYDSNFEIVEADESLRNLYRYTIDTLNKLKDYVPDYTTENMFYNTLPEMRKSIAEAFNDKGLMSAVGTWYDDAISTIAVDELADKKSVTIDPITGKEVYKLKVLMTGNTLSPEEKSYDLAKVLKGFSLTTISYKHKSRVEDVVKQVDRVIHQSKEERIGANGEIIAVEGLKNLKEYWDYAKEVFYGEAKAIQGPTDQKALTRKDIKKRKDIDEKIKELENSNDPNKEEKINDLKKEKDNVGNNVAISKVVDQFLNFIQVKVMGWNPVSPFINTLGSFVNNMIHAAGGEDFNEDNLFTAKRRMLSSMVKSATLDSYENKLAKKIAALMHEYSVVSDVDQIVYRDNPNSGWYKKGLGKLSPMEGTRRAEYLNQGVTFLALMDATIIKDKNGKEWTLFDAYDDNGKWKVEEFGERPEWAGDPNDPNSLVERNKFKRKLEAVKEVIHGNYNVNSRTRIKKGALGRAVMVFRNWIGEGFAVRFEKEWYDPNLGRWRKGRYRVLAKATTKDGKQISKLKGINLLLNQMLNFLSAGTLFKNSLNDLSAIDKAAMRKVAAEISIYIMLYTIALMLKHAASDDEDEKAALNYLVNSGLRLQNDMVFFISPMAFEKIMNSSIPAANYITDVAKFADATFDTIVGEGEYETGPYAGWDKMAVRGAQLFPGTTQIPKTSITISKIDER